RHRLLAHGVAAVFHDDDLVVVLLHVRQRFRQDARLLLRVGGHGLLFTLPAGAALLAGGGGWRKGRQAPREPVSAAAVSTSQLAIMMRPPAGAAKGKSRLPI